VENDIILEKLKLLSDLQKQLILSRLKNQKRDYKATKCAKNYSLCINNACCKRA
jgi:hypothetical protein